MNRKILLVLFLLVLLSGCSQRRQPDVEHFQGDVVATLQKSASQEVGDSVELTPPPYEAPLPSPQTSEPILTTPTAIMLTPTVPNPQATTYPPNYGTVVPTQNAYPIEDLTQTPAPTPGDTDWEGVWNIWYQDTRGGYTTAELTVQVNGTRLNGSAIIGGVDFSFTGDIFELGSQVEGEWETSTDDGTFWWRMNSAETFVGSRENRFGICGNRAADDQPNPCREVPQD